MDIEGSETVVQVQGGSVVSLSGYEDIGERVDVIGGQVLVVADGQRLVNHPIMEDIIAVAARGFCRDNLDLTSLEAQSFRNDVIRHVIGAGYVYLLFSEYPDLGVLGFVCVDEKKQMFEVNLASSELSILHIQGMVIDPSVQGDGLGAQMIACLLGTFDPDLIGYHTSNLSMKKLVLRFGALVPGLAEGLAETLGSNVGNLELRCESSMVIEKARYPKGGLYGESLGELLIPGLNEQRGDAEVVVVRIFR